MKKLLSLLLALVLLVGLVGCQGSGKDLQMQAEPSTTQAQTEGTTEPLFWPPLPTETEETAEPTQAETTPTEPEKQDQPAVTKPTAPKPTEDTTDATYIPREDEDAEPTRSEDIERPDDADPTTPEVTQPEDIRPEPTEPQPTEPPAPKPTQPAATLDPNGTYDSKEEVALFIRTYHRLPNNYYTKSKAESLFEWEGGALSLLEPGACIGGDRFYNNKGLIKGYTYYECDIDTIGRSKRGAKRLVFSYYGPIYYTDDHYDTFTLLYGEP